MAIPASHIVRVSSRVLSGGSNDLETNGLLLTTDTGNKFPEGVVAKEFVSVAGVADFFGEESEEYTFAVQYFKGVNNQRKNPTALIVGKFTNVSTAFPAEIRAICNVSRNWVGFTHLQPVGEEVAKKMGDFADQEEDYVAVVWSDDETALQTNNAGALVSKLNGAYNCMATVYGDFKDAAFVLANGASIAWERRQGVKTWFAKSTTGISPRIANESSASTLEKIRCNYYGHFATRNAQFNFFNRGTTTSPRYGFIDVLYTSIWLRNAIQRACMDGFASVDRAPYNDQGKTLIRAWCGDPIDQAKFNGCIDEGVTLSRAQRAQILQETGDEEAVNALFTKGYHMAIEFPPANGRADRAPVMVSLRWMYGGSVQKMDFEATVIV